MMFQVNCSAHKVYFESSVVTAVGVRAGGIHDVELWVGL